MKRKLNIDDEALPFHFMSKRVPPFFFYPIKCFEEKHTVYFIKHRLVCNSQSGRVPSVPSRGTAETSPWYQRPYGEIQSHPALSKILWRSGPS